MCACVFSSKPVAMRKAPPVVNPAAGRDMKRLVGTVKTGHGRVGKMLEMLESGGWDKVEREVKTFEQQEEKRRMEMGLSPRLITTSMELNAVETQKSHSAHTPATNGTAAAHVTPAATVTPATHVATAAKPLHVMQQGLKPERRILAYGLGAVQGKR